MFKEANPRAALADSSRRGAERAAAGRVFEDREYNRVKRATGGPGMLEDGARPG